MKSFLRRPYEFFSLIHPMSRIVYQDPRQNHPPFGNFRWT